MDTQRLSILKIGAPRFAASLPWFSQLSSDEKIVEAARRRLASPKRREKEKRRTTEPYYGAHRRGEEQLEGNFTVGAMDALLTRNHYGCVVINAAHALFIDVDAFVPAEVYDVPDGREGRLEPVRQQILTDLRVVLKSNANYGFRIYRTAGGFRILATSHEFEPGSQESSRLMNSVGADPDFMKLCRKQHNFRARLTPKPWRCGMRRPPNCFPRKSAIARDQFQQWLSQYGLACESRATCKFIDHVGPSFVHERIAPIISVHDRETKAFESLPLA